MLRQMDGKPLNPAFEALNDDADAVAAGMILFYGAKAETIVSRQVQRFRAAGNPRAGERWGRIAGCVRARLREKEMAAV